MTLEFNQDVVSQYCDDRKSVWDKENKKLSWWKNVGVLKMTQFLVTSVDELIIHMSHTTLPGIEKKLIVMQAIGKLYDYISSQCLPIWLKPFAPLVRPLILDGVISPSIDWIVAKYKAAKWTKVVVSAGF